MTPVVLYRPIDGLDLQEEEAAKAHFNVVRQRTEVRPGDLVIGRYSVLPFYKELEQDLRIQGAKLINSYRQHQFIADVMAWADILGPDLTPRTWDRLADIPDYGTAFVVKGQTNSRKDRWNTHMFAATKRDAVEVTLRLQEDSLIQSQRIYYRKYEKLAQYHVGLNGLPVTDEYRYFVLNGIPLTGAFYWSSHVGDLPILPKPKMAHFQAVEAAVRRLKEADSLPPFVVIDVATREDGSVMVVELNDGQMSGLSENDPNVLYARMSYILGETNGTI